MPPTKRGRHDGFKGFNLLRGIRSEIDFRRLPIRVSQPQRDLAEVPRGLQDDHSTRMTQDMRGNVPNRATTLFTPVCIYVDRVRSAEVLQYQCMVYRASEHHSAASPHDCFSKCWILSKVGKSRHQWKGCHGTVCNVLPRQRGTARCSKPRILVEHEQHTLHNLGCVIRDNMAHVPYCRRCYRKANLVCCHNLALFLHQARLEGRP